MIGPTNKLLLQLYLQSVPHHIGLSPRFNAEIKTHIILEKPNYFCMQIVKLGL